MQNVSTPLLSFHLHNINKSWPAWTLSRRVWELPVFDYSKLLTGVKEASLKGGRDLVAGGAKQVPTGLRVPLWAPQAALDADVF